jgi:hypothetical protein
MSVAVQEWYTFLDRSLQRGDLSAQRYAQDVADADTVKADIDDSELLAELEIMPALAIDVIARLIKFVAADASPQLQARFPQSAKDDLIGGGKIRLPQIASVLAYMYTFCSGLWLERLATNAAINQGRGIGSGDEPEPFAKHGADMVFAIDANVPDDERHCLVSIKRAQDALHMLIITFFQIATPGYSVSDPTPATSRLRVTRFVFDTRIGSDADEAPVALNAYLNEPIADAADSASYDVRQETALDDVSLGDTYYELTRMLYEQWRGGDEVPRNADMIRSADLTVAEALAVEAPRGAWFCLTLEWLAYADTRAYMLQYNFFGSAVARVRNEIAPPVLARDDSEKLEATLRSQLHSSTQRALADRSFSSAAVYAWTAMLINLFWLPLTKIDVDLLTSTPEQAGVAYFDSPAQELKKEPSSRRYEVPIINLASPASSAVDSTDRRKNTPGSSPSSLIKSSPVAPTQVVSEDDDDDDDEDNEDDDESGSVDVFPAEKYRRTKAKAVTQ